jgi:integrase
VSRKDRFASLWKALQPHFGHRLGKAISRDDCRDYHKARKRQGKSNSTVKTELEFLRACLRFHYKDNAPSIWTPPESKPRERYLNQTERDTLLANIEAPHVKLFVTLALVTGARMSALLDLTWDRVDLEVGTVDLNPAGREITNKRRTIVKLNSRAIDALKEAHKGRLTEYVIEYDAKPVKSIRKAIRSAAARAKVPCSPHVFRHTAGVWMANADVPMEKIAQRLGTTVRIAEKHYARFSPSYQQDAAEALNW